MSEEVEKSVDQVEKEDGEDQQDGMQAFLAERKESYKKSAEEPAVVKSAKKEVKEVKKPVEDKKPPAVAVKANDAIKKLPVVEDDDGDDDEPAESKHDIEIKRLNKRLSDSNKWAHDNNRKFKAALKVAEGLFKNEVITEEEFKQISVLADIDVQEPEETEQYEENPIRRIIKTADKQIEKLSEIVEDKFMNKKIAMFGEMLNEISNQEASEILEELLEMEDKPLKLANKMYKIGEQYYNETYKDIDEAGGVRKYIEARDSKEEKLQKKVDKLEKKLAQYESTDKPTYGIPELNEADGEPTQAQDGMTAFLQERKIRAQRR